MYYERKYCHGTCCGLDVIKFQSWPNETSTFGRTRGRHLLFRRRREVLQKVIQMSQSVYNAELCDEGIASLLCSAFFEPKVPCNLIRAHLSGVRKAIEPARSDPKVFARPMARQNPKISALWLAAIWTGHAGKLLDSALGGMPPISLPVAS